MKNLEFLESVVPDFVNYVSLIVFEPGSLRIEEKDILVRGPKVRELFDRAFYQIEAAEETLKITTINNRLNRLKMMLDLVKSYDDVIITKFLDKICKRYSFFSNLGEMFLELDDFSTYLPEYSKDDASIFIQQAEEIDFFPGNDDEDNESVDSNTSNSEAED